MGSTVAKALASSRPALLAQRSQSDSEVGDDDLTAEESRIRGLCCYLSVIRAVAAQIEVIASATDAPDVDDALVELTVHRVRGLLEGAVALARTTSGAAHVDPYGTRAPGNLPAWHGEVPRRHP